MRTLQSPPFMPPYFLKSHFMDFSLFLRLWFHLTYNQQLGNHAHSSYGTSLMISAQAGTLDLNGIENRNLRLACKPIFD